MAAIWLITTLCGFAYLVSRDTNDDPAGPSSNEAMPLSDTSAHMRTLISLRLDNLDKCCNATLLICLHSPSPMNSRLWQLFAMCPIVAGVILAEWRSRYTSCLLFWDTVNKVASSSCVHPLKLSALNSVHSFVMVSSTAGVSWVQLAKLRDCKAGHSLGTMVKQSKGSHPPSSRLRCLNAVPRKAESTSAFSVLFAIKYARTRSTTSSGRALFDPQNLFIFAPTHLVHS